MKKNLYFSTIFISLLFLILLFKSLPVFAAEENVILKFFGKAYATGFAGLDHQVGAEAKFLKERRGKIIISNSKDFQIKFEAKVGEDLWFRNCDECKVWYELYKEVNDQWVKIFETSFSGESSIKTKSETFNTSPGWTQKEPVVKYKVKAKARAKLSIIGDKSWGWKDFVFFVGVPPEGKISIDKGVLLEWLNIAEAREKKYASLASWAKDISATEYDQLNCYVKVALSIAWSHLVEIAKAGLDFTLGFLDYFEGLPTDFPSSMETSVSVGTSIAETLVTSKDVNEIKASFFDPLKDLKDLMTKMKEITGAVPYATDMCDAFHSHWKQMPTIEEGLIKIKDRIKKEKDTLKKVFYQKEGSISEIKEIIDGELSSITELKKYLMSKEGTFYSKSDAYEHKEVGKMVRSLYKPFDYVQEDETIANYFLTGKVTEAEKNRIDEEKEAAKKAAEKRPNLQPSLSVKEKIKANETALLTFYLSNVGEKAVEVDSAKTALKVLLDGNVFKEIKFSSFGKIPANESKKVEIEWTPKEAKKYFFFLSADPERVVTETSEEDNFLNKTIEVTQEDLPDLVAESLEIQSPESVIHPNEEVTIKAKVRNTGKTGAENIKVSLYLRQFTGSVLLAEKWINLDMGETTMFEAKWKPTRSDQYGITLDIDVFNKIREESEDNNVFTKTIKVEEIRHELSIYCLNWGCPALVVNPGYKTGWNFFVKNIGNITDEVVLDYEKSAGMIFAPQFSETSFKLQPEESKKIFISLDVPRDQPPGDYSLKIKAQTRQRQSPVSLDDLRFIVESPYKIEVLPLCNKKVCQDHEKESFNQREVEPEKITSFDFRIQNKGDEFDLGFWIVGNYNGKDCSGNKCYGVTVPQGFNLKKDETKDITLKVKGKEAGDYNLTLKFNVGSRWLLTTYSVTLKVKPFYDFGWKILKTYELDPKTKFQKFAQIEIENKSNTKAKLKAEVTKDSLVWRTGIYPPELKLDLDEKKIIELEAFSEEAARGWFLKAGSYSVDLKLTMADKIKTVSVNAKVKEFHKISINNWFKKKIPQAQVPLSFSVRNMGNVRERITVKLLSELKLEPNVITVETEPYSFKEGRSGLGYISTTIDARDFSPDKEYQIYIVAEAGDAKDEAITTIVVLPKFQFLCEEKEWCSHVVKAGEKTQYKILMLNGLDKDVAINLSGEAPEDEKWSWNLEKSEVVLKKGESKTVLLTVEAKEGAEGDYTIVLKGRGEGVEEEIKVITKIGELKLLIYPGWSVVSPTPVKTLIKECGNGKCESGETQENCCQDCGCPKGKICKQNQCTVVSPPLQPPPLVQCGNGVVETGETCDDGIANGTYGHCKSDCSGLGLHCGDGICQSANENTQNCPSDCPAAPPEKQCSDSDNGQDIYTKGTATLNGSSLTDSCKDADTVREYYCSEKNVLSIDLDCPTNYICSGGKCIEKLPTCADSDNGKDIWTKGTVTRNGSSYDDCCLNNVTVHEYFCDNNNVGEENIGCPSGTICQDGRCIEQIIECPPPFTDCLTTLEAEERNCQMVPVGPVCAEPPTPKWCFICP